MKSMRRALLFGFLTWLVPFVVAVFFYTQEGQLRIDIFLFKSIMIVVGAVTGALFLSLYFRKVTERYCREGILIGLMWLAINWALDFGVLIPMSGMDVGTYAVQIGLRYLTIPVFSVTVGCALSAHARKATA
jgi:Na+/proline symporter